MNKKNFCPKISPKDFDLKKRWYVYFDTPTHNGNGKKRIAVYGNINDYNTINERVTACNAIIATIVQNEYKPPEKIEGCPLLRALQTTHLRQRSTQTYVSKIKIFKAFLGLTTVDKCTAQDATNFIIHLQKKQPGTINNYRMVLSSVYNLAVLAGYLKTNPFTHLKKIKSNPTSKLYFNATQKKYLAEKISMQSPGLWLAVQLIYYCFIRPKELRFLLVGDINFDNNTIMVRVQ
jgi:hypothetical protein